MYSLTVCAGSSWLRGLLSSCSERGPLSSCSAQSLNCGGFSLAEHGLLGALASVVAAPAL